MSRGSPAPSSAVSEGASTDDDASSEPQRYATHTPDEVVLSEEEGGLLRRYAAWHVILCLAQGKQCTCWRSGCVPLHRSCPFPHPTLNPHPHPNPIEPHPSTIRSAACVRASGQRYAHTPALYTLPPALQCCGRASGRA